MDLTFTTATDAEASAVAALRTAVAEALTARHGRGPWSSVSTERGVLFGMRYARVLAAWGKGDLVGTLRLATKKPWAIDRDFFTPAARPLYLTDMAIAPPLQGRGLGRHCLEEARRIAREWPADAIFLDAFDAPAGAGGFYRQCGFRETGRVAYRDVPLIYFEWLA